MADLCFDGYSGHGSYLRVFPPVYFSIGDTTMIELLAFLILAAVAVFVGIPLVIGIFLGAVICFDIHVKQPFDEWAYGIWDRWDAWKAKKKKIKGNKISHLV